MTVTGNRWEVRLYETAAGRVPVLEFLLGLPARVLYLQDAEEFVLFQGFHKTHDKDLDRAVAEATRFLADYRAREGG